MIKLHEFFGEEENLRKIEGCMAKSVECIEQENESILHFTFENSSGKEFYLAFTDGEWHFGDNEPNFEDLSRDKQISAFFEEIHNHDKKVEIILILSIFTAYNLSKTQDKIINKYFDNLGTEMVIDALESHLNNPEDATEEEDMWNAVIGAIGVDKIWSIINEIDYYMDEYHKITMPLEEEKYKKLEAFASLARQKDSTLPKNEEHITTPTAIVNTVRSNELHVKAENIRVFPAKTITNTVEAKSSTEDLAYKISTKIRTEVLDDLNKDFGLKVPGNILDAVETLIYIEIEGILESEG